jgi:hypothetical protein
MPDRMTIDAMKQIIPLSRYLWWVATLSASFWGPWFGTGPVPFSQFYGKYWSQLACFAPMASWSMWWLSVFALNRLFDGFSGLAGENLVHYNVMLIFGAATCTTRSKVSTRTEKMSNLCRADCGIDFLSICDSPNLFTRCLHNSDQSFVKVVPVSMRACEHVYGETGIVSHRYCFPCHGMPV